jgi:hypothetical protein
MVQSIFSLLEIEDTNLMVLFFNRLLNGALLLTHSLLPL